MLRRSNKTESVIFNLWMLYFQKKKGGPDRSVSNDKFSSVTLNELAMKARENIL